MKWLSSFLDWLADPPHMARSTAIVTGVERIERVKQVAYPPRHQDPGGTFTPSPAGRERNPRLAAPLRQIAADLPRRPKSWEVRYGPGPDGAEWSAWRDMPPGRLLLPMPTERFELRAKTPQ